MSVSEQQFKDAADRLKQRKDLSISDEQKLKVYGLYKQATVGDCNTNRPGMMDFTGKAKWDAWNQNKGMTTQSAQSEYVSLIDQLTGTETAVQDAKNNEESTSPKKRKLSTSQTLNPKVPKEFLEDLDSNSGMSSDDHQIAHSIKRYKSIGKVSKSASFHQRKQSLFQAVLSTNIIEPVDEVDDLQNMEDSDDNMGSTTGGGFTTEEPEPILQSEYDLLGELEINKIDELLDSSDYSLMKLALQSGQRLNAAKKTLGKGYDKEKELIIKKYQARRQKLMSYVDTAPFMRLKDKLCFVIGTLLIIAFSYIMGSSPNRGVYVFSAVLISFLVFMRFFEYKSKGWHYYLVDFCYFGNVIIFAFLLVYPKSRVMFKISYLFANGPLAYAIVAFRNSLVFHKIDYLTSLGIHVIPLAIMVNFRWVTLYDEAKLPESERFYVTFDDSQQSYGEFFTEMLAYPIFVYFCWAVVYYLINFVISDEIIKKKNYDTTYMYFGRMKWAANIFKKVGPSLSPLVFIICHFLFFLLTHFVAILCYYYKYLNIAIVCALCLVSFWNGAGYYMSYFAKNYERQLATLKQMEKQIKADNDVKSTSDKKDK